MSGTDFLPKITIPDIFARKKEGRRISMITAYDYPSAQVADDAGIDIILVGDSLGMVVLGYENTLKVTMEEMIHHTKAAARGRKRALLIGDMPYLSYHTSVEDAVRNAGRFVQEGGAEGVKVEGGRKRVRVIRAILDAEIPVMGHIGLTPQSIHMMGGYKVQGRIFEKAEELVRDAKILEEEGVFSIVLEGIPDELSRIISSELKIPTIGIGAGRYCDGQVLVFHDLLGFNSCYLPKFVRKYANLNDEVKSSIRRFISDVQSGDFPSDNESYSLPRDVAEKLLMKYGVTAAD
ncbi:MAG: 3-methyl-2-oxobutanoate hydroxymethyltransferase [Acidobacteriota bacterium]